MLIAGGSAAVVTGAMGFDEHAVWEGLDARDALPPLLQPGVLWDWDAWDAWECAVPGLLATDHPVERSLAGSRSGDRGRSRSSTRWKQRSAITDRSGRRRSSLQTFSRWNGWSGSPGRLTLAGI
jgi:hypothetical protein